jgi:hypothetical protein
MKYTFKYLLSCLTLILFFIVTELKSQQIHFDLGLRSQKSFGLYFENGVVWQVSSENIAKNQLSLGLGYTTSRLGSAIGNNAIKQDNYQIWLSYYFNKAHRIYPFVSLGSGYFSADYESDDFKVLDHSSALFSATAGFEYNTPILLKMNLALGYNFISGNGLEGPGTLYPVFAQLNFYYPLK